MIKTYKIQGIDIVIDESNPNVFHPHPITKLLAESIEINPGDEVLEVCSGSGLIAITAAKLGAKQVYASDISSHAFEATKANGVLNNLNGELKVYQGDYFEPFKNRKFDVIISNPPCMPFPKGATYINEGLSLAVDGGEDGTEFMSRFMQEAKDYLKHNGSIYFPIPDWSDRERLMRLMRDHYFFCKINEGHVKYYLAEYNNIFAQHITDSFLFKNQINNSKLFFKIEIYKLTKQ